MIVKKPDLTRDDEHEFLVSLKPDQVIIQPTDLNARVLDCYHGAFDDEFCFELFELFGEAEEVIGNWIFGSRHSCRSCITYFVSSRVANAKEQENIFGILENYDWAERIEIYLPVVAQQ